MFTIEKLVCSAESNGTLFEFLRDEVIWEIVNSLEKRCCNRRYVGYLELLGIVAVKDITALDQNAVTGRALYLAFELLGSLTFWSTMSDAISYCIKRDRDTQPDTLSEDEVKKLLCLLKAAI